MTPTQVKTRFAQNGETFKDWAAKHGYKVQHVYLVLNGQCKAKRGKGHEIAVKLGLK